MSRSMIRDALHKFAAAGAAITLAAGLAVAVQAEGTLSEILLVCPPHVWAGQPINGYVTGGEPPMMVDAVYNTRTIPGFPKTGPQDPLFFQVPTWESMAGSTVFVIAGDFGGDSVSQTVIIF